MVHFTALGKLFVVGSVHVYGLQKTESVFFFCLPIPLGLWGFREKAHSVRRSPLRSGNFGAYETPFVGSTEPWHRFGVFKEGKLQTVRHGPP